MDENGVYLLAIVDEPPTGHHTNDWWHMHRKVCINKLKAFNGKLDSWQSKWEEAVTYEKNKWYRVQIQKTEKEFVLSVYDDKENMLKSANVQLASVFHVTDSPDYLVIGDPHENYYQGSVKIKEISIGLRIPLLRVFLRKFDPIYTLNIYAS
jgi:hypothetical protein